MTFRRKFASCEKPIFFRPKAQKSGEFRRNRFALLWNNTVYSMVGLLTLKFTEIICFTEGFDSRDETVPQSCDLVNSIGEAVSKPEKDISSFEHVISNWPTDVAGSHIWDQAVRREVKETKMTEQELNRKRSELLVPSSQLNLNPDEISHIPVLLVQQPGWSG